MRKLGYGVDDAVFSANVDMRLELKEGIDDSMIIDDTYNSDINSVVVALNALHVQAMGRRRVAVISDIQQSGMDAEQLLKAVLSDFEVQILEKRDVEYRCYCSRERVTRALISMGRGEMESLIEEQGEAELTCQFCDAIYHYSKEELEEILNRM
jgi:hypothetical protein